jgi:dTDP-4-dehydrorhamnose 3,5-epimerase
LTVSEERGSFTRVFDGAVFETAGFFAGPLQYAVARNSHTRKLRGLHYQAEPHGEAKQVCCLKGRILGVVVDPRPGFATFRCDLQVILSEDRLTLPSLREALRGT